MTDAKPAALVIGAGIPIAPLFQSNAGDKLRAVAGIRALDARAAGSLQQVSVTSRRRILQ